MSFQFWVSSVEKRGGIYPEDVRAFREYCQVGDRLTCFVGRPTTNDAEGDIEQESTCVVTGKYPYVATTTKGTFQWSMLTIWNKHVLRAAQKYGAIR